MSKYRERKPYKPLSRKILEAMALGATLYVICSSPTGTRRFIKDIRKDWRKNAYRVLDMFRTKELVEYVDRPDGTIVATITKEGKQKIREWQLEDITIEKPKQWDGNWHIIAFDISEKRKRAREAFRSMLKRLEFHQLQRSIFVHPYPCQAEIELLQDVFLIPKNEIIHIITSEIPSERLVKKTFHLA